MEKSKWLSYWFQVEAVQFNFDQGFQWASGIQSPIYIDNRRLLSIPETRKAVLEWLKASLLELDLSFTHIAGVATGAIGYALLLADEWRMPFFYVRPKAKTHGLKKQIEGICPPDASVLLIEDLVSTGESVASAKAAIEQTGAKVISTYALFSYHLPTVHQRLSPFQSLFTFPDLMAYVENEKILNFDQIQILNAWHKKLISQYGEGN
jgi:orotate phosphoribosyltransferase